MTIAETVLAELDQEAQTTRRVLERVPGDRLGWKPHPLSMTLGQLALHVAILPGATAQAASLAAFQVPEFKHPSAQSAEELLPALDESLATAHAIVGGMSDETLTDTWKLMDGDRVLWTVPRISVIRSLMLNHWYHHRGQLSVYLRQLDVPLPSIYGPSADVPNPFTA